MQQSIQWHADKIAREEGIDPHIFRALVGQESGWNAGARSPVGAQGYTQLMAATARGLGVNPNKPLQNLRGGARYLAEQLHRFGGNYAKALAAYNAGPGAVQKYGGIPPYAETQHYVSTILSNAKRISVSDAGKGGARGKGGSKASGPVSVGGVTIPGIQGAQDMPVGSTGILPLLQALQQSKARPASSAGLQAPSFAAAPVAAAGAQVPVSGGGPQPKPDVSQLLQTIQTQGGSVANSPGNAGAIASAATVPAGGGGGGGGGARPDQVEKAIHVAKRFLGVHEVGGANRGPRVDKIEGRFGMSGEAWCGLFVGTIMQKAGVKNVGSWVASTAAIQQKAMQRSGPFSGFSKGTAGAKRGDLLMVRSGGPNGHVEYITHVDPNGTIHTIGGNVGDAVRRQTHRPGSAFGVAHVRYR